MDGEDELKQAIATMLQKCLEDGMVLPFIICAAAVNGSVIALRFHRPGDDMEMLVDHSPSGGMQLPISIMISDRTGKAAHMSIAAEAVPV